MNSLIITLAILLGNSLMLRIHSFVLFLIGMVPVATSISCYYCNGCAANAALTSDGVTTYTFCGVG